MPDDVLSLVRDSHYPQYAYGVFQSAILATRLGIEAITVAELGVAGGNGLLELQRLCETIGMQTGTRLHAVGFDLGSGMPPPVDYRDMPYVWQQGFYGMDEARIRARLTSAELVLGDIAQTGPAFMAALTAPLGFLSFDLDYYSSTASAMRSLLEADGERYLPRVFCYFDDTVGPHEELHSKFTGELLAIEEFNAAHARRKIAKIHGFRHKVSPLDGWWVEGMHVLHLFDHPRYCDYVYPKPTRQRPIG
jgi:hypothetical protein